MKNLILVSICFFISLQSSSLLAQIKAVTENGDTVYLYTNGTWSYELEEFNEEFNEEFDALSNEVQFDTITKPIVKSNNSTEKITSKLDFINFYYDKKLWKRIPPGTINSEAEFAFKHKEKDVFAAIISEEIEIGMTMIYQAAIMNAENGSGNPVNIIKKEIRTVNGVPMIHAIFEANFNGFEATFMGNYYSGENGTVQFISWTGTNIFQKHKDEMEALINGAVIK
jgi:hypothetical protein